MRSLLAIQARLSLLLGLAVVLLGCGEEPVRVYHVNAEAGPETTPPAENAASQGNEATVRWAKPASWKELPPDGTRLGNYTADGGDGSEAAITVIRLGGTAGGTLANVNRWRGQLMLEPVTEESLESEKVPAADGHGDFEIFDLEGGEAGAMLAAQLPLAAETWFFKLTGSMAAVAAQRENFMGLLQSVEITAGSGDMHEHDAAPPVPTVAAPKLEVPEGWEESEGSSMRLASFRIVGDGGHEADVSVVSLKDDGGGLEANLNLWRTQMQLRDLTMDELKAESLPVKSGLGDLSLVHFESTDDLLGEGRKAAIVGAMGQVGARTWFFKMAGDLDVVAAEKEKFIRFVEAAAPQ
jgi:hypothetical protein